MRRAIYPGSFDPVTNGHLDIIARGCALFDEIMVAILVNPHKTPLFTTDERRAHLTETLSGLDSSGCTLRVDAFQGLLTTYARTQNATAILRGLRSAADYEYEKQMTLMNRRLTPEIETVFLLADERYAYVSSRLMKEVCSLGGSLEDLVPASIASQMRARLLLQ